MSPRISWATCAVVTATVLFSPTLSPAADAAPAPIGLGTASAFAVLAGSGVTNTGSSVINGDLGTTPTPAVSGFPPGVLNGVQHLSDGVANIAQDDLTTAYNQAAASPTTFDQTGVDLAGKRLIPGVYTASSALALNGAVTLDAQGDPDAEFIFKAGTTLITGTDSAVTLAGGAQACHVWWQVGTSATLGTRTAFAGTIMALTSASLTNGATVQGRVLARNGAVTLDNNTITRPSCSAPVAPTPTATPTPTPTATPTTKPTSKPTKGSGGSGGSTSKGGGSGGKGDTSGGSGTPSGTTTGSGSTGGSDGDSPSGSTSGTSGSSGGAATTTSSGEIVPSGHPETGRRPSAAVVAASSGPWSAIWLGSGLLLVAAGGALARTRVLVRRRG